jgi:hypothetical protein
VKPCPFCAETVQDNAIKCRYCGEVLDPDVRISSRRSTYVEPDSRELARLAEIRRLQRVAGGQPTRQDTLLRAKGFMALVIVGMILTYAYIWKRSRGAELSDRGFITYRTFSAAFGPTSPLPDETKVEEFENYRGLQVVWEGHVAYINRGRGRELYASIRHRAKSPTSDVLLRFPEPRRDDLDGLPVGTLIRYSGRLIDFGAGNSGFITLIDGRILERLTAP